MNPPRTTVSPAAEARDVTGAGLRVLLCGDRLVAADIATFLRREGADIVGLGVNQSPFAECPGEVEAAAEVAPDAVFHAKAFTSRLAIRRFIAAAPDLGVCCGFASVLPRELLEVPRFGWVNLHRSYLPYNRGLDPLQWALVDGTPAGVTLHVMTESVDAGPVLVQKALTVLPTDDFDTLGKRADVLAFELFTATWPRLRAGDFHGVPQDEELATHHSWADCQHLRRLDPKAMMSVDRLLAILRGYSGAVASGAYFEVGPLRYMVHTKIIPQVRLLAPVARAGADPASSTVGGGGGQPEALHPSD